MPKFSANLTMMFNEVEFLGRFERAAKSGFKAVEYMFPYEWPKEQLAAEEVVWACVCSVARRGGSLRR